MGTDRARVGLQTLLFDHIEHRAGCGHRNRVAAKGVEVAALRGEAVQHLGLDRQSGHRVAVAHRFAERHDIGHQAMAGKAPEVVAGAAKAGLDLVGDEQATGLAHRSHRIGQPAGRIGQHAIA